MFELHGFAVMFQLKRELGIYFKQDLCAQKQVSVSGSLPLFFSVTKKLKERHRHLILTKEQWSTGIGSYSIKTCWKVVKIAFLFANLKKKTLVVD